PACGHRSLFLGSGGYITCSIRECRNPTAAADLLDDGETRHVVTFTDDGFSIRHPLIERADGTLDDCELHAYCLALDGPPVKPGTYRAERVGDRWRFWGRP